MTAQQPIYLIYDMECPACDLYSRLVRVRDSVGKLELVDARTDERFMPEITAAGLDIDQGMVLKVGERLYYGADAIQALALMGSRSGVFNRINYWVFRSRMLSRVLYPVLRACRNLLLKVLGKTKINNLEKPDNGRF